MGAVTAVPAAILDRHGRIRSPVTLPAYRQGVAPANKGRRFPPEPLSAREVQQLLAACSRQGSAGIRNRALIVVLWRAGLRVQEALDLAPKDVDLDTGTIAVLHGKGDRRRIVGLDPQACDVVDRWRQRRARLAIRGGPLFCAISEPMKGGPIRAAYVREALKGLAAKAGVEKRVHPHGLRHTHAFELAQEGVPVHVIRRQLGHTSLATTERYINHLHPSEVLERMRARPWPESADAAPQSGPGAASP